ncbi:hypothetical protein [uncultured Hoeflea sp.]|uniref:hypothetical protein n=1 Tax=uncultured Hoeflea sp. TaxID=538666 RepID=UPI0030D9ED20
MIGDHPRGPGLIETEFGIAVQIVPPFPHFQTGVLRQRRRHGFQSLSLIFHHRITLCQTLPHPPAICVWRFAS